MIIFCEATVDVRNIDLNVDNKLENYGFFATLYYDINDRIEAKAKLAIELTNRINNCGASSSIFLRKDSYYIIKELNTVEKENWMSEIKGFTFYPISFFGKIISYWDIHVKSNFLKNKNIYFLR